MGLDSALGLFDPERVGANNDGGMLRFVAEPYLRELPVYLSRLKTGLKPWNVTDYE